MIAMFHISGGGGNRRKLEFVEFKPIDECYDWDNLFYTETDEEGNEIPEEEWELISESGRVLMDADKLKSALATGIGRLEFDSDHDTTYTTYAEDLDEDELDAMVNVGRGFHYIDSDLDAALRQYGFTDEEINVARYFDDLRGLVESDKCHNNYIEWNYDISDAAPEDDTVDTFKYKRSSYIRQRG